MLRCLDVMSCARTKKKSTTPQKLANSREKKNLEEEDKCAVLKYNIPLNFFFVFLFSPFNHSANVLFFFVTFLSFSLSYSKSKIKSRRWHILPLPLLPKRFFQRKSSWQSLLFANFELHCDSYTFSLRLLLKQLNNISQFMMNEHAKKSLHNNVSHSLFYQSIITEAKQSKA